MEFAVLPCATKEGVTGCLAKNKDMKVSRAGVLIYLNVQSRLDEAIKIAQDYGCEILLHFYPLYMIAGYAKDYMISRRC